MNTQIKDQNPIRVYLSEESLYKLRNGQKNIPLILKPHNKGMFVINPTNEGYKLEIAPDVRLNEYTKQNLGLIFDLPQKETPFNKLSVDSPATVVEAEGQWTLTQKGTLVQKEITKPQPMLEAESEKEIQAVQTEQSAAIATDSETITSQSYQEKVTPDFETPSTELTAEQPVPVSVQKPEELETAGTEIMNSDSLLPYTKLPISEIEKAVSDALKQYPNLDRKNILVVPVIVAINSPSPQKENPLTKITTVTQNSFLNLKENVKARLANFKQQISKVGQKHLTKPLSSFLSSSNSKVKKLVSSAAMATQNAQGRLQQIGTAVNSAVSNINHSLKESLLSLKQNLTGTTQKTKTALSNLINQTGNQLNATKKQLDSTASVVGQWGERSVKGAAKTLNSGVETLKVAASQTQERRKQLINQVQQPIRQEQERQQDLRNIAALFTAKRVTAHLGTKNLEGTKTFETGEYKFIATPKGDLFITNKSQGEIFSFNGINGKIQGNISRDDTKVFEVLNSQIERDLDLQKKASLTKTQPAKRELEIE